MLWLVKAGHSDSWHYCLPSLLAVDLRASARPSHFDESEDVDDSAEPLLFLSFPSDPELLPSAKLGASDVSEEDLLSSSLTAGIVSPLLFFSFLYLLRPPLGLLDFLHPFDPFLLYYLFERGGFMIENIPKVNKTRSSGAGEKQLSLSHASFLAALKTIIVQ